MLFCRYELNHCGAQFRVLQLFGDNSPGLYSRCRATWTSRLVPRIGVTHKGNAFYPSDSRHKTSGKRREYWNSSTETALTVSKLEG